MDLEQMRERIEKMPPDQRAKALEHWNRIMEIYRRNPLERFHCCPTHCGQPICRPHPNQHAFGVANTRIAAAFAGNRFGKTAIGCVKSIVNCMEDEDIPERLRPLKFVKHLPAKGRVVGQDLQAWQNGVLLPELRKWTPRHVLEGESFDKAWSKVDRILKFKNGSFIQVMTNEMDVDKFGGPALDFVWFDEPPREDIYDECAMRIGTPNGLHLFFTMTPLNMEGAEAAFVYREIYKKREAPHITVVRGSIHDNPHLLSEEVEAVLEGRDPSDPRRRAREFGDFAFWGGLVYPGGFEDRLVDPLKPEDIRYLDVVVGIDPGLRNAAFIWIAFDNDNRAVVFDELLIQNGVPSTYARGIRHINRKWGLTGKRQPIYIIDPSAKNRSLIGGDGSSVEALLQKEGIYAAPGNNEVEAGCMNILDRMFDKAFHVAKNCAGLRDEADEYHTEKRDDGEFKPIKGNDHRLDACRYACMHRLWVPYREIKQAQNRLGLPFNPGFQPDHAERYSAGRHVEDRGVGELV